MSLGVKYWIRVLLVGVVATAINALLDIQLGIKMGSGRDWLIFFVLLGLGFYFFVIRWCRKVGYGRW